MLDHSKEKRKKSVPTVYRGYAREAKRGEASARRVQAKQKSGAKGYVAMRLDVTGGTSLVGFVGRSTSSGAVQDERGRNGSTCTRCIYAATNPAICRELLTTESRVRSLIRPILFIDLPFPRRGRRYLSLFHSSYCNYERAPAFVINF